MKLLKWSCSVTERILQKCSLNHEDQHDFYMCQWQNKQKFVNNNYMIYRICFAVLTIAMTINSFFSRGASSDNLPEKKEYAKYFIYITNWGFIAITVQGVLGMIVVVQKHLELKKGFSYDHCTLHKIYWALHNVALDVAPNVTLCYWKFVFNPAVDTLNFTNLSVHVFNIVIMFVDFWLVAFPTKFAHAYCSLIFGVFYMTFNVIYVMSGGTNSNSNPYVYKIFRFKENFSQAFVRGVAVLLILLFWRFVYFCLYLLKRKIDLIRKASKVLPAPIHM